MTEDLVAWLLEQIAEDERLARTAARLDGDEPEVSGWDTIVGRLEDAGWEPEAVHRLDLHVCNWDPARVLAECDAKRRIVEHCQESIIGWREDAADEADARSAETDLGHVVKLLALHYAERPGYRPGWRPDTRG